MRDAGLFFTSRADMRTLAYAFRSSIENTVAPGRRLMADHFAGGITFETPRPDAFDEFSDWDYEVQARIPLTGGINVDVVFVSLTLRTDPEEGGVQGVLTMAGPSIRRASQAYFDAAVAGLGGCDPYLVFMTEQELPYFNGPPGENVGTVHSSEPGGDVWHVKVGLWQHDRITPFWVNRFFWSSALAISAQWCPDLRDSMCGDVCFDYDPVQREAFLSGLSADERGRALSGRLLARYSTEAPDPVVYWSQVSLAGGAAYVTLAFRPQPRTMKPSLRPSAGDADALLPLLRHSPVALYTIQWQTGDRRLAQSFADTIGGYGFF